MRITCCGVRGSTPAPGHAFAGIGGHTSCVEIAHDGGLPTLVIDAGTGLRSLTQTPRWTPWCAPSGGRNLASMSAAATEAMVIDL